MRDGNLGRCWIAIIILAAGALGVSHAQESPAPSAPPELQPNDPSPAAPIAAEDREADKPTTRITGRQLMEMPVPELLAKARVECEAKNYNFAKILLDEILRRDETHLEALTLAGESALESGDGETARERFLRVIDIQPNDFRANYGLGELYLQIGLMHQSLGYLLKAQPVVPPDKRVEHLVKLAQAYRGTNNPLEAAATIRQALELDPNKKGAIATLVGLLIQQRRFDEALPQADKLIELTMAELREDPGVRANVEELYQAYDAKLTVLRAMHQRQYRLNPDGSASSELLPGEGPRAAKLLDEVVTLLIFQSEIRTVIDHFGMITFVEQAIDYDPGNVSLRMRAAQLYELTSQLAKAAAAYQEVIDLAPDNTDAASRLALLLAEGVEPAREDEAALQPK